MATIQSDVLCQQAEPLVAAGLRSRILLPADSEYTARIDSYWCNNAKLKPACMVQPHNTEEVSKAVAALTRAQQLFAVRAGGHTNWAGSNNIDDGVTIDLGLMNSIEYDPATQMARIQPGAKWKDVFEELEKHGRTLVGAREGFCGVGGFLLGGGNTFLTPRYGFGCDNVVANEVVLADGRVVIADAEGEHSDLFRALKGGSNNFGIVTCFTMLTHPNTPIWGGLAIRPLDVIPAGAEALVDFTANAAKDPDTNLQYVVGHHASFGGTVAITLANNMAGIADPPALQKFKALPEIFNNFKDSNIQEVLKYSALPYNYHNIWFTLTFKNDASIVVKASELHNELAKELKAKIPDEDFTSHVAFQPLPLLYVQQSHAINSSGNVLGLEQNTHDGIVIQAAVSVRTPELEDWARPKLQALVEELRAFAGTIEGGMLPWLYLNYAHPTQKVLQSYGPDNVRRIREVAAKYDPEGTFQRLCPGGFKISAVKD